MYDVVLDNTFMNSDIDLMSSSLDSGEIIMEHPVNSFSDEVLSYDFVCLNNY